MDNLGVISYGVSITTLEEVFLKINQEFNINIGNAANEDREKDQSGRDVEDVVDVKDLTASVEKVTVGEALRSSINETTSPKGV
jgi:hypothetical protein